MFWPVKGTTMETMAKKYLTGILLLANMASLSLLEGVCVGTGGGFSSG